MGKEQLKIVPKLAREFGTKIILGGRTYLVESEELGNRKHILLTRIFHNGKILSSYEVDYQHILGRPDFEERLSDLINWQQSKAIENLKLDLIEQEKTWKDFIKEIEVLVRRNKRKEALALVVRAVETYPNNPVICSYQGMLEATANRKCKEGIGLCKYAITVLKESIPLGGGFYLPLLYLNLGKAHLAAARRREAYVSFQKGLALDNKNGNIFTELEKLGIRRKPPVSFLKRTNLLNKCIGKLRHILTCR
jgi:tetratricopeptide (TPR) repeat protein